MGLWTCVIGWFRFTVPDAIVEDIMSLVGDDWIKDQKGFQGYAQAWLSRGNSGGLGRIKTGSKCNPREVHVGRGDSEGF